MEQKAQLMVTPSNDSFEGLGPWTEANKENFEQKVAFDFNRE